MADKSRENLDHAFNRLGRTAKCDFIDDNIQYARMTAIIERVKPYIFDLLDECDLDMIKQYLETRQS